MEINDLSVSNLTLSSRGFTYS